MTALRGIANGWGDDITGVDLLNAYAAVRPQAPQEWMRLWSMLIGREIIATSRGGGEFVRQVLARQLVD